MQAVEVAPRPDLIVLDVMMPVMDGLEAARRIRALPAYARTPILAMTANAFAEDRAEALGLGMNDHIPKPVDPAQLRRVLAASASASEVVGSEHAALSSDDLALRARRQALPGLALDALLASEEMRALQSVTP